MTTDMKRRLPVLVALLAGVPGDGGGASIVQTQINLAALIDLGAPVTAGLSRNDHAVERKLAHVESNKVRATYNKALLLDERRTLLQTWANYLALDEAVSTPASSG